MTKWSWAWKEAIVAYLRVPYRHFPENELQYTMKIPQDNRPPGRFEPKTSPIQSVNNSTTTFGISVLNMHSNNWENQLLLQYQLSSSE